MSDVVAKLWGFCHTLRHEGVDYGDPFGLIPPGLPTVAPVVAPAVRRRPPAPRPPVDESAEPWPAQDAPATPAAPALSRSLNVLPLSTGILKTSK